LSDDDPHEGTGGLDRHVIWRTADHARGRSFRPPPGFPSSSEWEEQKAADLRHWIAPTGGVSCL